VLYNCQLLCIAARQTYDINSQDSPVNTRDHQRNCRAAATAITAGQTIKAGPAPQSFVGGPHPLCDRGRHRRREGVTRMKLCLLSASTASALLVAMSCQ